MARIIFRKGFYFVVQSYGRTLYTYAVCETEKQAQEILDFVITSYD